MPERWRDDGTLQVRLKSMREEEKSEWFTRTAELYSSRANTTDWLKLLRARKHESSKEKAYGERTRAGAFPSTPNLNIARRNPPTQADESAAFLSLAPVDVLQNLVSIQFMDFVRPHLLYALVLILAFSVTATGLLASSVVKKELAELVAAADHVLICRIARVEMVDETGTEVHDPDARTGPGLKNELRLHLLLEKDGVLKASAKKVPEKIVVPLWKMWHYTLGQWKQAEGGVSIYLLKGETFGRVSVEGFDRSISEKQAIEELIQPKSKTANSPTTLAIDSTHFTIDSKPTFLLGFSYYGALGASDEFLRKDLDDFQRLGFNWLRVWATWDAFDHSISAFDLRGEPREPYFTRLKSLVADCDRRGLIVDITLSRQNTSDPKPTAGQLPHFDAHLRAVESLCTALKDHRNWYLDLSNERDVRDRRFVSTDELKRLRQRVRELDPQRIVTASFGGHDLSAADIREALLEIRCDFLARHRPRHPKSPSETEAETRACLQIMRELNQLAPLHDQEPFRRGYTDWQPTAADFLTDLRGAIQGGAAGWCFHNGSQRTTPDEKPRRSFDLRTHRLLDQLDPEELKFIERASTLLKQD